MEKLICPNCGRETNFPIFHHLNISLEPRFKEEVLSQRLFQFRCGACSYEMVVSYPMLYSDPEKKLMLFLLPDKEDMPPENLEALFPLKEEGYIFRIVRDILSLAEKIEIRDAGLDDRVLEFFKYHFIAAYEEEFPEKKIERVVFQPDKEGLPYLLFLLKEGQEMVPIREGFLEEVTENWEEVEEEGTLFQEIDLNWAKQQIENK